MNYFSNNFHIVSPTQCAGFFATLQHVFLFGALFALVNLLAMVPRDIIVLPHVLYLALHGEQKEHNEIDEKNWPEHRHVEGAAKCHE
ncbi:hypothetical protein PsorP6_011246 [Peronosclerospora sorghi]|uniref:Uncharacterized protein n=1 Tax=Peronosclerospora sorghi TaxID=230839 RepID=A0ACC0WJW2_9STRA|nr:hypothetical protein PsorP6_011246 [Peronosclerospora sorghi]